MKNANDKRSIGQAAEEAACRYLQKQGLKLKARNVSFRAGELDLVMQHHRQLVFVEVRFRSCDDFGSPFESVNYYKQQRIIKAAHCYLHQQGLTEKLSCRFDVISLKRPHKTSRQTFTINEYQIQWLKNAFTGDHSL